MNGWGCSLLSSFIESAILCIFICITFLWFLIRFRCNSPWEHQSYTGLERVCSPYLGSYQPLASHQVVSGRRRCGYEYVHFYAFKFFRLYSFSLLVRINSRSSLKWWLPRRAFFIVSHHKMFNNAGFRLRNQYMQNKALLMTLLHYVVLTPLDCRFDICRAGQQLSSII